MSSTVLDTRGMSEEDDTLGTTPVVNTRTPTTSVSSEIMSDVGDNNSYTNIDGKIDDKTKNNSNKQTSKKKLTKTSKNSDKYQISKIF